MGSKHDLVAKITENMEFWIFLYCGLSVILQSPAPCSGWGYWESKVRIVIHMAQEYYSFMLNRFFETLVILLIANDDGKCDRLTNVRAPLLH